MEIGGGCPGSSLGSIHRPVEGSPGLGRLPAGDQCRDQSADLGDPPLNDGNVMRTFHYRDLTVFIDCQKCWPFDFGLDEHLIEAMWEVDELLPGSPPITPPMLVRHYDWSSS